MRDPEQALELAVTLVAALSHAEHDLVQHRAQVGQRRRAGLGPSPPCCASVPRESISLAMRLYICRLGGWVLVP